MKILIVKTTSMGDVVHAVPVIADIRKHFPEAKIDWLAEDVFADIPRLTKGVDEVLVCSVRKWKKSLLNSETRKQISALKSALRQKKYDLVIDLQGLIKSAVLASWTHAPVAGYDRSSIKEPLASFFYHSKFSVSRQLSAVERCRSLAALALGYEIPSDAPQFLFQFTEQK